MTSLGKTLVLVNLGLSLAMATWAHGLYATRIDWSNNKGKDGAPDGELVRRIARLDELGRPDRALTQAAAHWNGSRTVLASMDERRAKDRTWYEGELGFDRNLANKAKPARVIKMANGQPVLARPGTDDPPVALEPGRDQYGQPLQSWLAYNLAQEAIHKQLEAENKALASTMEEDKELTNRLAGDGAGGKGLQQRILDERAKLVRAINEQDFVRPLLINAVVNSQVVFGRQRELEARIKELEKVGVAGR
jgi:hypothetical protein